MEAWQDDERATLRRERFVPATGTLAGVLLGNEPGGPAGVKDLRSITDPAAGSEARRAWTLI
jgi:hypothetical protein